MNEIIGYLNISKDNTCSCIKAGYYKMGGANFLNHSKDGYKATAIVELYEDNMAKKIRIRKLTERECFRLMGVDDADIDKIKDAGISRSQQYKMAGNSIVVDVLYHIFDKAFINTQNDDKQLELF